MEIPENTNRCDICGKEDSFLGVYQSPIEGIVAHACIDCMPGAQDFFTQKWETDRLSMASGTPITAASDDGRADAWEEGATMVLRANGVENVADALANLADAGYPNPYHQESLKASE